MENFRFNYIITIHNKENLIERVLKSVISCSRENSYIYPVLDGCTDRTESIINNIIANNQQVPIKKVYVPNVHEILSINAALKIAPQNERGCNIILQDDVILEDPELERKVLAIYNYLGYSSVGSLVFRHGVNIILNNKTQEIEETDLIESCYGVGICNKPLPPQKLIRRMVGVRSPECISCEVVSKVGLMDENLAPYTYDNHDYSLRCLVSGYKNYVFALKFNSDIEWSGMRNNPLSEFAKVTQRNRKYLYKKYYDFLKKFPLAKLRNLKTFIPTTIPGINVNRQEIKHTKKIYNKKRQKLIGLPRYFFSFLPKVIKIPLQKIYYFVSKTPSI